MREDWNYVEDEGSKYWENTKTEDIIYITEATIGDFGVELNSEEIETFSTREEAEEFIDAYMETH